MLSKFSVKNFKSFKDELVFDLSQHENYDFNKKCIKNGIVNKAIIYGYNGVGKTNLALAIMDIVIHLADKGDKQYFYKLYENYLNANSSEKIAEFTYTFDFNKDKVEYNYGKTSSEEIVYESLLINGKKIIFYDRRKGKNQLLINFEGTEVLKGRIAATISSPSNISLLTKIKSNAVLSKKDENAEIFNKLMKYVNNMLLFSHPGTKDLGYYLGYKNSPINITEYIAENKIIDEVNRFFKEAKLEPNLKYEKDADRYSLYFNYSKRKVSFWNSCSSGARALMLFYFWLQFAKNSQNKPSLMFIDEFDAFYHFELSKFVIEKLKETSCQVILTTHNTSIMDNDILRPDCYFFMYNNKIKSLVNSTKKDIRYAHDIEKMYKAGAFNNG